MKTYFSSLANALPQNQCWNTLLLSRGYNIGKGREGETRGALHRFVLGCVLTRVVSDISWNETRFKRFSILSIDLDCN